MCYIRITHTHDDGKQCYHRSRSLTEAGLFQINGGEVFGVGFMAYTGSWYAYNLEAGQEIARFSREFFQQAIAPFRISSLVPDPDCVVA